MTGISPGQRAAPESDPCEENNGIVVRLLDRVLTVTLERPRTLNGLTTDMLIGLANVVDRVAADERVKVLVLRSAGRAFSAGADLGSENANHGNWSPTEVMDAVGRVIRGIVTLPLPVVAVVRGPAAGLGASLALACDVVLCSQTAYFVLAFTKIGLMPDGGATALVPAAVGRLRAMHMALLAERVAAEEALGWGLVTAVHADDALDTEADALIARLAGSASTAMARTKQAINAATLPGLADSLELEKRGQAQLMASAEFANRVAAFRNRP